VAGSAAHAVLTAGPTAAQRSAAEAAAVAGRWQSWSAGRIFPAGLGYRTSLQTQETARRAGVAPATSCAAGLDPAARHLAARDGCRAVLRATYVDELQGVVYTIGVLAFSSGPRAAAFLRGLPPDRARLTGLRARAFPGTASAAFSDGARQASAARQQGPYVVLAVAGYTDGRAAAATAERRRSVFAPAAQLAAEIIRSISVPAQVDCHNPAEWAC
jgi:hypothetical protein